MVAALGCLIAKFQRARSPSRNFVLDLETVIDSLNVERVSLLGVSMGAATALAYAFKRPLKVHRLALHGAFATGRKRRKSSKDAERATLRILYPQFPTPRLSLIAVATWLSPSNKEST